MRRAASLLVLGILLTVGLAGSASPAHLVDTPIAVFLMADATEQQKQAVEARLRAVPGMADVVFESSEEAYARYMEMVKDIPDAPKDVEVDQLPESFRLILRNRAAFDRAVAGPLRAELRLLPGVDDIVYLGMPKHTSVSQCVTDLPAVPSPPGLPDTLDRLEVRVFLGANLGDAERQAIEARLRAVPGAAGVRLETREQAAERFRELFKDVPELVGLGRPELLNESFLLRLADEDALGRAADADLDTELCRLPGVDQVHIPPKRLR
ncbi:permease-like cell division protein FtsX [Plantactinospora soyae]|uniref:Cell division protein FtsX n=1 Tax=Plantactinospora soyae TaxID=1544732 RepID=A0A927QWC7_9ACTN|nr:permease-like cell division protein FtsX [Plantactinospora soyae]MBE1486750.1 cell division protein FtsX [Plantactinospora soyae]